VGSKLEESRSSSSCWPRDHECSICKIIGIKIKKDFGCENLKAHCPPPYRGEYRLFVGSSESDLGGLLSFGLPFLSALLDFSFLGFFERSTGRRTTDGRSLPRRIIFCSAAASHSSRQLQG